MSYSIHSLYKNLIYKFCLLNCLSYLPCPFASLLHSKIDLNNNFFAMQSPRRLSRPLCAQRHFVTRSLPQFLSFGLPLVFPAVAGGHESCPDAVACFPGCGRMFLPPQRRVSMICSPLAHVYSKSRCCNHLYYNVHLCSRRPLEVMKVVLPLPLASRVVEGYF